MAIVHVLTNKNYDHAVKGDSGDLLYNFEIGSPDNTLVGGPDAGDQRNRISRPPIAWNCIPGWETSSGPLT